jgi:hypothetical protein
MIAAGWGTLPGLEGNAVKIKYSPVFMSPQQIAGKKLISK